MRRSTSACPRYRAPRNSCSSAPAPGRGRRRARRGLPAHGHLGRAPACGRPGRARVRLPPSSASPTSATSARTARSRRRSRRAPRRSASCCSCRVRDARDGARRHPYRARRTGANSAPGSWSAPTGPSRRCAARPASTRAAGTTVSAPSSPTSTARSRMARPPGSASSTPGRLRCCRSPTGACRWSGRRFRSTPKRWCSAPTANSRSA